MKKPLYYFLALLLVFTFLFPISDSNARLEKEELPPESIPSCIFSDRILIIDAWFEQQPLSRIKKGCIDFFHEHTGIRQDVMDCILNILHEVKVDGRKHLEYPFTWCTCKKLTPYFRYFVILHEVVQILKQYPPFLPPYRRELVLTSFAEGGLLQTYCLVYVLRNLGYNIHLNIIGDEILEIVAGEIPEAAYAFPAPIMDIQAEMSRGAITRGFGPLPGEVKFEIYKSATDYINDVKAGRTPRSMMFNMIDSNDRSRAVVYATTPLPPELKNADLLSAIPLETDAIVRNKRGELRPLSEYVEVRIFAKINGCSDSVSLNVLQISKTTGHKYDLRDILHNKESTIAEGDVERLVEIEPMLGNIVSREVKLPCYAFLVFIPKQNTDIFETLISETCVPVEDNSIVALEANNNRMYWYRHVLETVEVP